jgi:hypothetical protein
LTATQALFQEESTSIEETEVTVPLFAAFSVPEFYYAPDGSVTISNPVETYYQSLPLLDFETFKAKRLTV